MDKDFYSQRRSIEGRNSSLIEHLPNIFLHLFEFATKIRLSDALFVDRHRCGVSNRRRSFVLGMIDGEIHLHRQLIVFERFQDQMIFLAQRLSS